MKVVQVSLVLPGRHGTPDELLAAWPTLTCVAEAVARTGASVTVVLASTMDARVLRDGVIYRFVSAPRPAALDRRVQRYIGARAVAAAIREVAPDVVHIHGLAFPLSTRLICEAVPGTPVMVQDHASRPKRGWRRWVHRWGFQAIAGVTFTARSQAQPFKDRGILRPELPVFEVIEGSTQFAPGDQAAARAVSGLRGDPCVLWLGHLNANKDPLTVLEGFRRAAPALPDPHLWCCYRSAPLIGHVRAHMESDPVLRQRVHLLGTRPHSDVEHLLRAADFLVQGSRMEGSGFAVIEGLACGVTPIVTDIPSFRRITGGGAVAGLWPCGDVRAMENTLTAWARRDRRELRQRARRYFERELSYDAIGRQLRAAYGTLSAGA